MAKKYSASFTKTKTDKAPKVVKAKATVIKPMEKRARDIEKDRRINLKRFEDDTNTISLQRYKRKMKNKRQSERDEKDQQRRRSQSRQF